MSIEWLLKNIWILFIAVIFANALTWWFRGKRETRSHPELAPGYRRLVLGFLVFANIPWVVMGVGILSGEVPTMFHFLQPTSDPFVLSFWVSVIATSFALAFWVFARDGAQILLRHPGLFNPRVRKVWAVKALIGAALLGELIGFVVILLGGVPPGSP